jgi:phosphoribosylanthranilate isomerase
MVVFFQLKNYLFLLAMWNTEVKYTRIKLCLFEYFEAAYEASRSGADALGFHILQSNKENWRIKANRFSAFLDSLPSTIEKVLLIDHNFSTVLECLEIAPFTSIQLYPDWSPEVINQLRRSLNRPIRIIKVMSAKSHENTPADFSLFINIYSDVVDAILLDSCREGGSGIQADLMICADIVRMCPIPVFLAGGLNASNVATAIEIVRPFGVDVETGVSEKISGFGLLKSINKCNDFVSAVMRVDRALLLSRAANKL